jgi:hypothetical protein
MILIVMGGRLWLDGEGERPIGGRNIPGATWGSSKAQDVKLANIDC